MDTHGIGISNLPSQRRQSSFRKKIDYNVMVAGANGLGKTTFLSMLLDTDKIPGNVFASEDNDADPPSTHDHASAENTFDLEEERWYKDAPVNFQKYVLTVAENGLSINLSLIEADNIGNSICNVDCAAHVEAYIKRQLTLYRDNEDHMARAHIVDTRVHVCLFFLAPNLSGPTHLELCVMKRISKLCNLVPIIAKSDILSPSEIQECYDKMRTVLRIHSIPFFGAEIEEGWRTPPYFLITFPRSKQDEYVRQYPWGMLRLDDEAAGDFFRLRDLLVRKGFCQLVQSTKQLYLNFKTNYLIEKYNLDAEICHKHNMTHKDTSEDTT
jgi:septin family protein